MRTWIFNIDDKVRLNDRATGLLFDIGKTGEIYERLTTGSFDYIVRLCDGSKVSVREHELDRVKKEIDSMEEKEGYYTQKGHKLGKLVDTKQDAYGNSIKKASQLMKVFLQEYKTDGGYFIPDELLDHILIQVRIIDKQNRIFSNPKADKMSESPYDDISGYGLLGGEIQNAQG